MSPRVAFEEASRCLLCLDAPCSEACPAGTDPAKFIRSLRFLNVKGAAETIRENNALGSICARVCPTEKYCQKGCLRSGIDRPLDIGGIQEYITDFERESDMKILSKRPSNGKKVAIIGSGPSGLEASAKLASLGYGVDVYEEKEMIGGALRYAIPEGRLPSFILDYEIKRIADLGVNFITGSKVGRDIEFKTLKKEYDAVLIAVGYSVSKNLPLFPFDASCLSALEFLEKAKTHSLGKLPENVVVIGGGDVAMDVIASLRAEGVKRIIDVVYEELREFKASKKEKEEGFSLADSIICGYIPVERKGNKITFKHRFLGSVLEIESELTIICVGQTFDMDGIPLPMENGEAKFTGKQIPGEAVFFSGDIAHDDKSVVSGVKTGKEAALAIDAYLKGAQHD